MTEFTLSDSSVLGLMPESGIVKLLGKAIVHPSLAHGVPRSELYLVVDNAAAFHARGLESGAREVSPVELLPAGGSRLSLPPSSREWCADATRHSGAASSALS